MFNTAAFCLWKTHGMLLLLYHNPSYAGDEHSSSNTLPVRSRVLREASLYMSIISLNMQIYMPRLEFALVN